MTVRRRVLVIDDDAEMRKVLTHFLQRRGHEVEVAEGAADASVKLMETTYDVLLVDIMMPGINGLEFLKAIREIGVDVDSIIITGSDSPAHREEANLLGVKGYFVKPFEPEGLLSVIDNFPKPQALSVSAFAATNRPTTNLRHKSNGDLTDSIRIKRSRKQLQTAIVKLGKLGLSTSNLDTIIQEAFRTIIATLEVQTCGVYQLLPDGGSLILSWGAGWQEGSIGRQLLVGKGSQSGYTLLTEKPAMVENYLFEKRFERHRILQEHDIFSGITVAIHNSGTPFGVLGVYSNRPRKYTETELYFLQSICNIISEVHERKDVEDALAMSEEKYRNLFEESKDVVFVSTPEGELIDINPAGVRLFGYSSKEEMLQINIEKELFFNSAERQRYHEIIASDGYVKDFELLLKAKSGEPLFVQETSTAVRDDRGNIVAYRGMIRDLTRLGQLQQQLKAKQMESTVELSERFAEDFGRLLNEITASCELIRNHAGESSEIREHIRKVEEAAAKGAALVSDLRATNFHE